MPSTPAEVAQSLTAEEQRRLAAEPDLLARFNELTTEALSAGPGRPGACGNNPFWSFDFTGAEIQPWKLFKHAAYTVGLDRNRAAQTVAA